MSMPEPLARLFPADRQALLHETRALVDEAVLVEIAHADYGFDAAEHLAALRPIWGAGRVPGTPSRRN